MRLVSQQARTRPARIRRLVALGTLAAAAATTAAGPVAPASAGGDEADPPTRREAERIVEQYNEVNTRNNATLDLEGQGAIEDPPIREIDDAVFREHRGRGATTLGDEFTVDDVRIFVPDQSSHPLRFFSLERLVPADGSEPSRQLLVFEQADPDAPWKVTMAASLLPEVGLPRIDEDGDGRATLVTGARAADLEVRPGKLAKKLAKLWRRSSTGMVAPKPFEPGLLTSEAIGLFVGELEQLPISAASVDFEFEASDEPPLCLATANRGALCYFVVDYEATLEPARGVFVQPDTREALTGLVEPGEYGAVTFERTAILLAAVPRGAPHARVQVIGLYNGLLAVDTSPPGVEAPSDPV